MRGFRHWKWNLDQMYVRLNGEMVYLWRAVDHEGEVLESYVTKTRSKAAALRFMKKALKRHGSPEAIVTDGLRSYRAAMSELGNADKQEVGRWANNRVENSHLPFRRRERAMLRFRQMKLLQNFASVQPRCTITSTQDAILSIAALTRNAALLLWQSGSRSPLEVCKYPGPICSVETSSHPTDSILGVAQPQVHPLSSADRSAAAPDRTRSAGS